MVVADAMAHILPKFICYYDVMWAGLRMSGFSHYHLKVYLERFECNNLHILCDFR